MAAHLVNLRGVDYLCDQNVSRLNADFGLSVSPWNWPGSMMADDLSSVLSRLARLELTRKVLRLRAARDAVAEGRALSAVELPGSEDCPEGRRYYELSPDGGLSIAFGREISLPEWIGVVLPTRYTESPSR